MLRRVRATQVICLLLAAVLAVGAARLQQQASTLGEEYELVSPGRVIDEANPDIRLWMTMAGSLRSAFATYLWISAQDLKEAGRHYDARQRASLICRLQPRFPGAWVFHSWNMAYNISVEHDAPEERWQWVTNGMTLLRDEGIPINPKSLELYRELGWLFLFKIAGIMDDQHMYFKRRWAGEMQRLLGAPPAGTSEEAVLAFRPIADAPLTKSIRTRGRDMIQADDLKALQDGDPQVKDYVRRLAPFDVKPGWSLLDAYNRWSLDESIAVTRVLPPVPETQTERVLSNLINSPDYVSPRAKLLAFVRAQILWNVYKMDPEWMLGLMGSVDDQGKVTVRFGPLDWRLAEPHGLYWLTRGVHVCQSIALDDVNALNTDRILFTCLQNMTFRGHLMYVEDPLSPAAPRIQLSSDLRYVEPTHRERLRYVEAVRKTRQKDFDENIFADGHINYLDTAIKALYAAYRREEAQRYFDWIKDNYAKAIGRGWDHDLVGDYIITSMRKDAQEGGLIMDLAKSQISSSLSVAHVALANGNSKIHKASRNWALQMYAEYQKSAPERTQFPPFEVIESNLAAQLLIEPRNLGYYLSLTSRAVLYANLSNRLKLLLYDRAAPLLYPQCEAAEIDFARAFPEPVGLEEFRRQRRSPLPQTQ